MFVLKDNRYLRLSGVKLYNHHAVWSTTYSSENTPTPTGAFMKPAQYGDNQQPPAHAGRL